MKTQVIVLLALIASGVAIVGRKLESRPAATAPQRETSQTLRSREVDLQASDGTLLKASYFAAERPGPGVLLLHQGNRQRKEWDGLASQLAAAGINALTIDLRGFGESGGKRFDTLTGKEKSTLRTQLWPADINTAWQYLVSQPGVKRDLIGLGGAGHEGVNNSVHTARRHAVDVKSLVLLSGQTDLPGRQFLQHASQLPELLVAADDDEYPPTEEVMEWIFGLCSNPGKKFIRYTAAKKAPWNGHEDTGVSETGGHGTDMFKAHPDLIGIVVDWFVTTLISTPGHAPTESLAAQQILNDIEMPGGVARVTRQLMQARRKDPEAELFPEVIVATMGYDQLRDGDVKLAIEIMKLNIIAYPQSADAYDSLSDAYLANGQKALAREYAEKAMALLNSNNLPASSWSNSEARRNEIRTSVEQKLNQLH